jgi:hypothetical protein
MDRAAFGKVGSSPPSEQAQHLQDFELEHLY